MKSLLRFILCIVGIVVCAIVFLLAALLWPFEALSNAIVAAVKRLQ